MAEERRCVVSWWPSAGVAAFSIAAAAADGPVKLAWPAAGAPARLVGTIEAAPSARLVRPAGITVDDSERVYVADPMEGAVLVYDRKTGSATRWTGNTRFPLKGPVGVALDGRGRLFVTDGFQPQVVVFEPSGNPTAAFGNDILKRPGGIGIDPANGRIWVADTRQHQVLSFDPPEFRAGHAIGVAAGRFSSPSLLAVNSQGHLFVSDRLNCEMQIFDSRGAMVKRFEVQCNGKAESSRPNLVAVDRSDCVYVASPDDNSLQIFSPEGKPLQFLARLGPPAVRPYIPAGLAVRGNRIYVVEQGEGTGRVQIYSFTPPARSRQDAQMPGRGAGRR